MIALGEDKKINVNVTQTYTNSLGRRVTTPVDLTAFSGYLVFLYSEETNVVIQKYSLNPVAGYVDINVIDATTGKIQLWLDKSITTSAPLGMMYGELKTSIDNTDFSLDQFETVAKFPVDTIVASVTNGINPVT